MNHRKSGAGALARSALVVVVTLVALVAPAPNPAQAAIPGVDVFVPDFPFQGVPAGSNFTASVNFVASNNEDPMQVSIEIQGAPGFATMQLTSSGSDFTGCVESPTVITCDWDPIGDGQPTVLGVDVAVDSLAPPFMPANFMVVISSATIPDSDTYENLQIIATPPTGSTTLSGVAINEAGEPVEGACIFILTSPLFVFQTVTDSSGNWAVTGLPDDYTFAVAAVPPFTTSNGPCNTNNGPPPIPGPGDLQPVFVDDVWIDLSDPALTGGQGDPYVFAVNAGATVFDSSATGLESCFTTAPASANPRPPCGVVSTTSTTIADELPFTGGDTGAIASLAGLFIAAGALVLTGIRRSAN